MQTVNYHILKTTIIINHKGRHFSVDRDSDNGRLIIEHIKASNWADIIELIDIDAKIAKFSDSIFHVFEGELYSYGERVTGYMGKKIIEFHTEGLPFEYLLKFWHNLRLNPSDESRENLFRFLEANDFPLTPDGFFIAYKKVTSEYMDLYSREISNAIGDVVEIPREDVTEDPSIACASGLHVASWEYANNFQMGQLIEVKVNPADVVSVPYDYGNAKCRCCKYVVVGNAGDEIVEPIVEDDCYVVIIDADADESSMVVEDDVRSTIRLGNIAYTYRTVTEDMVNFTDYKLRRPSRWAKGLIGMYGENVINNIKRKRIVDNMGTLTHSYIVTLNDTSNTLVQFDQLD